MSIILYLCVLLFSEHATVENPVPGGSILEPSSSPKIPFDPIDDVGNSEPFPLVGSHPYLTTDQPKPNGPTTSNKPEHLPSLYPTTRNDDKVIKLEATTADNEPTTSNKPEQWPSLYPTTGYDDKVLIDEATTKADEQTTGKFGKPISKVNKHQG